MAEQPFKVDDLVKWDIFNDKGPWRVIGLRPITGVTGRTTLFYELRRESDSQLGCTSGDGLVLADVKITFPKATAGWGHHGDPSHTFMPGIYAHHATWSLEKGQCLECGAIIWLGHPHMCNAARLRREEALKFIDDLTNDARYDRNQQTLMSYRLMMLIKKVLLESFDA